VQQRECGQYELRSSHAIAAYLNLFSSLLHRAKVILVAAAGNDSTSARVYPASITVYVMGIASHNGLGPDLRLEFLLGRVWIAGSPGE